MKTKHWMLFLLLGAIWSSSFMWIKIALNEVGPVTLVAFRVLFGFVFCAAVIFIRRIELPRSLKEWYPLFLIGVTNLAVPFFLISWGEQSVDSSVASILDATVPLFTIVMAHFMLSDDKMTAQKITGLLTGFAGVIVLLSKNIGTSASGVQVHTDSLLGQGAVVLASLFYAGSGVYIRKSTQNVHGMLRSGGPLLSASLIMWISVFITESPVKVPHLGLTWTALLFLGVVGSGIRIRAGILSNSRRSVRRGQVW